MKPARDCKGVWIRFILYIFFPERVHVDLHLQCQMLSGVHTDKVDASYLKTKVTLFFILLKI